MKNNTRLFMRDSERRPQKIAFITGVTGQDGSYLAEFLLNKGYEVHAIIRRTSTPNCSRIASIRNHKNFILHYGDLTDSSNLHTLLGKIEPDEIYNLGAQSHVGISFEVPEYTAEVDAIGVVRLLDAIKDLGIQPRFYQASTSELFGGLPGTAPQSEATPFYPRSPYGASKLYAYWVTVNYREAYGLYACNGILFNHESPRRGLDFVTKKISRGVADIVHGRKDCIYLGNLDAMRDWGYTGDFVEAMWLMLQQSEAKDFVIATGECHSVREFVSEAFQHVNIEIEWHGKGVEEIGIDAQTRKVLVRIDPQFFRPTEVEVLQGDFSKAQEALGWTPKTKFHELVQLMVEYDLRYDEYGGDESVCFESIAMRA